MDRLSVEQIGDVVRRGERTAVGVSRDVLERRDRYDQVQPQAWIHRVPADILLANAAMVDSRVAAGQFLPLAGVPYAVKDNIDVMGVATTAGCPAFAYMPERSATVIELLEQAGALFVGKTNLDQFATGLNGTRSPFGAPRCVFNLDYVSGGSSSGSAVVTAAGVVAFALGTDTAGSGRVPAAFNHLVGMKPTRGRWSTKGLVPACRSLDCISVFASTTADAARVDAVLAMFDPADPFSRRSPPPALEGAVWRIGVPAAHQRDFLGDGESRALFEQAIDQLSAMGLEITEVDIEPLLEASKLLYAGPWLAERTAAIEQFLLNQPDAIHPVVREIIGQGFAVSAIETFRAYYGLKALQRRAEAMWRDADALMLPTTPTCYRVCELEAAPVALNSHLGLYTNSVNLLDMSAIAVPAGFRRNGTGFGITFIGAAFADVSLQALAMRFEESSIMTMPNLDENDRAGETALLAVVGAHLQGMPLHWQLTSRGAKFIRATRTIPAYRLYAMAYTTPPKPALVHVGAGGAAIELELYEVPMAHFGSFVNEVPPPLAIGTVTLEDGSEVKGFVSEPRASRDAEDITDHRGWRAYLAFRSRVASP